jgi:hypothetical protein
MTQVKLLLDKTKQIFLPRKSSLVFNFQDIFDAWAKGKCTSDYLYSYCMKQVGEGFLKEIERRRK